MKKKAKAIFKNPESEVFVNVTSKMKCNLKSAVAVFVLMLLLGQICLAAETPETKSYNLEACLQLAYQNSEALKTATLKIEKAQWRPGPVSPDCPGNHLVNHLLCAFFLVFELQFSW